MSSRILFFQLVGGASGDMLLSALHGLGVDFSDFCRVFAKKYPHFGLKFDRVKVSAVVGWQLKISGIEGARWHANELPEWSRKLPLSTESRRKAKAAIDSLVEAEAAVHDLPRERVHFHELESLDTLVDVFGYFYGLERLGVEEVYFSAVPAGRGFVKGEHGEMPNPPPAVAYLMSGLESEWRDATAELVTPTALALLKTSGKQKPPPFIVENSAYAFGARASVRESSLRAFWGAREANSESLVLIETNVDDITPEQCAFAIEAMLRKGAKDALAKPVLMKKGRPGWVIQAWASAENEPEVTEALLKETGTLGYRRQEVFRIAIPRKFIKVRTRFGDIKVKIGFRGKCVVSLKPEYEECVAAARRSGVSLSEVIATAREAARRALNED